MSHPSPSTNEAGVLVVDQHYRLRSALRTELCPDCSITAYEARTCDEAVALTQAVQPDVILLDPGMWDSACAQLLQQILEENAHFGLQVFAAPDARGMAAGHPKAGAAAVTHSPSVAQFSLALRHACRERLEMEPDMVHQLFRTWHQDDLKPGCSATAKRRQLKVLVLALRTRSNWSEQRTWPITAGQRGWPLLMRGGVKPLWESCCLVCHARIGELLQRTGNAGNWTSHGVKMVRQWGHALLTLLPTRHQTIASSERRVSNRSLPRLSPR